MDVIPSIDVLQGNAVRLIGGQFKVAIQGFAGRVEGSLEAIA